MKRQILFCILMAFSMSSFSQKYERYMRKAGRKYQRFFFAHYKGADKYYTKALELDSTNCEVFWRRGRLRNSSHYCFPELARKDLQKAFDLINQQLLVNSTDTMYWKRGFVNMNLTGNMQATCEDFKRAGELGQKSYNHFCKEK